jgi:membrane protein
MLSMLGLMGFSVQTSLVQQIESLIGSQAAEAIKIVVDGSAQRPDLSRIGGVVGFVALFFSASGTFAQIQSSLNVIWEVPKTDRDSSYRSWIKRRLLSMGMVFTLGFLALVSLLATAVLNFFFSNSDGFLLKLANSFTSWLLFSLVFSSVYKILPDLPLSWKNSFKGGMLTALLFAIGKELIGLYLGKSALSSAYGAMASLMLFLIWVYYSSLILLLGAELSSWLNNSASFNKS